MDTITGIKVVGGEKKNAKKAIDAAFKRMKEIEKIATVRDPKSEIFKINQQADKSLVDVSYEMCEILKESLKYSKITDGAFDVTIGVLSELWNFASATAPPPRMKIIDSTLLVGYEDVKFDINKRQVLLGRKGMKIDLSSVEKGYAVEEAAKVLTDAGYHNFLISLGDNIKAVGTNQWGFPWKVGIRHPRSRNNILTTLKLQDMAVATSGDYEHYFTSAGQRYHHILDPQSGYPVSNGCVSVTIITPSAFVADILSTAVFVLGQKAGMDIIEDLEQVEGVIVTDKDILVSSGLTEKIQVRK
ncbi:FAD:protein FMN transferase [Candidatus Desantisbacteria bacterium]|nr:FAD:protein FMN transferase [Candidatus Desantisbacteria bacterium]